MSEVQNIAKDLAAVQRTLEAAIIHAQRQSNLITSLEKVIQTQSTLIDKLSAARLRIEHMMRKITEQA